MSDEGRRAGWINSFLEVLQRPLTTIVKVPALAQGPQDEATEGRLRLLLADYQSLREEEAAFTGVIGTMSGVAIALLGGILTLLPQVCRATSRSDCLPGWSFLFIPLVPFTIVGYMIVLGSGAVLRGFYLRALEREINLIAPQNFHSEALEMQSVPRPIPFPSYSRLSLVVASLRRGEQSYRFVVALAVLSLALLFGSITVLSLQRASAYDGWWQATGVIYFLLAMLLLRAWWLGIASARPLWAKVIARSGQFLDPSPLPGRTKGGSLSYFFIPRPTELVVKPAHLVAAMLLARLAYADQPSFQPFDLVLFVVVFELLIYQARYILNDMRDLESDALHPKQRYVDGYRRCGTNGIFGFYSPPPSHV